MKVDCKIFKGIEYVQVSELPQTQREMLNKTIASDLFIKILVDGKVISGCLQYKDYLSWYQQHYQPTGQQVPETSPAVLPGLEIKPNLAGT